MSADIGNMWEGFLGQMTAQGATRQDIITTTLTSAHAILQGTQTALWPDTEPVADTERPQAEHFAQVLAAFENAPG